VNLSLSLLALSVPFVGGDSHVSKPSGVIPGAVPSKVECFTTKGNFVVEVHNNWAPIGASHFLELVADNFFTDIALFRCVPKFLAQFGISADPAKKHWHNKVIKDDPHQDELKHGLKKYQMSYAGGGKNSRSTHLFIAYEDLPGLGKSDWEVPFGIVTEGRETIDAWYTGYGDMPPWGKGPEQGKIHNRGNQYIHEEYPLTDFIKSCRILKEDGSSTTGGDQSLRDHITSFHTKKDKDKDRLLRSDRLTQDARGLDTSEEDSRARNKAFTAVAVLVVAIGLLLCLYKFSTISEGKSQ